MAATLVGTVVVGAFDAVLMLALPSLLVWAALGVLTADEPGKWDIPLPIPLRGLGMLLLIGVAGAFTVKSGAQMIAMAVYDGADNVRELKQAARLDPGSYRIQLRLARSAGDCTTRKAAADAAHELYPEASGPKGLRGACGRRRRRG